MDSLSLWKENVVAERVKRLAVPSVSVTISSKFVKIPLMSNCSGACHVTMIEVEDSAMAATLDGAPVGAT